MDFPSDLDFLAWYFTFFDNDYLICPHCEAKLDRNKATSSFKQKDDIVICPNCSEAIGKDDIEEA